jgi:hypothetical protein
MTSFSFTAQCKTDLIFHRPDDPFTIPFAPQLFHIFPPFKNFLYKQHVNEINFYWSGFLPASSIERAQKTPLTGGAAFVSAHHLRT